MTSKSETGILLVTFFSTLFLELEFAIYLGIILSLVIFLNKTSTPEIVTMLSNYDSEKGKKLLIWTCKIFPEKINDLKCPQLEIIRIDMSIYFGSVNHIENKMKNIQARWVKNILIVGTSINFIDMSWLEMLENEAKQLQEIWGGLYFTDLKTGVFEYLYRTNFIEEIGKECFYKTKKEAISWLYKDFLKKDICKTCKKRVFSECWKGEKIDYSNKNHLKLRKKYSLIERAKKILRII